MATFVLTGFDPAAWLDMGGGQYRLPSDWSAPVDALTFTITDDDGTFDGDDTNDEIGNDGTQSAVVTDASGTVVGAGQAYLEDYFILDNGAGTVITVYSVEIGGVPVGYVATAPVQPGETFFITGSGNVPGGAAPAYSAIADQTYDQDADNTAATGIYDDSIEGGAGNDSLDGGLGNDTIDGGAGADTIFGGSQDDSIHGGDDADLIQGEAGNDTVFGGEGDDTIGDWGAETGNDLFYGEGGDDSLIGGSGNDTLYGGTGADFLTGGAGIDYLYGEDDADLLAVSDDHETVYLWGGEGGDDNDFFALANWASTQGVDVWFSGDEAGEWDFFGTAGTGTFAEIEQVSGTDYGDSIDAALSTRAQSIWGGAGDDTITASEGGGQIGAGEGADIVYGGSAGELVSGDAGADSLFGDAGDDTIYGGDDNDLIVGDEGADWLDGEDGDDELYGATGSDTIYGGGGADTLAGEDDDDSLWGETGDDELFGGLGNDYLDGGGDQDWIEGGDGDDTISPGGGDDTVFAGAGNDRVFASTGADEIHGGTGDDSLSGGGLAATGHDTIFGDEGADTIDGGLGNDLIYGGDDADEIRVTSFGNDTVWGGEGGVDDDLLDLGSLSADLTVIYDGPESGTISDGTSTLVFHEIERLVLGDGADSVDGHLDTAGLEIDAGDGANSILGGSGDDTITGGADQDWVLLGDGNDSLDGGDGNDLAEGGTGSDTLLGGSGADSLYGEDGADSIDAGDGDDLVLGGLGNDTLLGDAGNDSLRGEEGDDYIDLGSGDDTATGADGVDTLIGGEGADWADGGAGNDLLEGGTGNDSLFGGYDSDTLLGQDDDDYLYGSSEDDTLDGGAGNDTLWGGTENDVMTGGEGDDTFWYIAGGGADTITDFGTGTSGGLDDGDQTNNDFINLAAFYDNISELHADFEDDGVLNQSNALSAWGEAVDYSDNSQFQPGDSLTFAGASKSDFTYDSTNVVCFAAGSQIATPEGHRPVEELNPGDLVLTLERGAQPVVWRGSRNVPRAALVAHPNIRPVRIARGAFGARADLILSPQHCVLHMGRLIRAKFLPDLPGVRARIAHGKRDLTYHHLMLPGHFVIFANGVACESFYPGPLALRALDPAARQGLIRARPALAHIETAESARRIFGPTAHPVALRRDLADLSGGYCPPAAAPDTGTAFR